MAAPNLADLFGDSDDDDDFMPSARPSQDGFRDNQKMADEEPSAQAPDQLDDDDDDFQDKSAPRQPQQLREYSDEDEDTYMQERVQERPVGPPLEMSGALLPQPAINSLRLLQTSKFLAVQTKPMTAENLKAEREAAVGIDEETNEIKYSYKKQMTVRWRERTLPSGETVVESNARFVKWSNGTMQLLLGDEVLDIAELDNTSANQYLFVRHTHPVAFIQGQGQLTKKLHLRPASLSSKFHKQLTAEAARKHVKVNKVKATATVADPSKAKAEREKAEEERIRSRENLQRRQDREMRKYPTVVRREFRPTTGITPQFLESIEDEPDYSDDEDLTATERARSALQRRRDREEEDEREAERRLARAKQELPTLKRSRNDSQEPEDNAMQGFIVDDDDEEEIVARQPAKRGRRGLVLSDDEDD